MNQENYPRTPPGPGSLIGRWTVLAEVDGETTPSGRARRLFECQCSCGNVKTVSYDSLSSGRSNSCGCLRAEQTAVRSTLHGGRALPEYAVWNVMIQRCHNPKNKQYGDYGGRGIAVCDRWHSFGQFISDMGRRPTSEHSIERLDNDQGYSPSNCKWATRDEQNQNRRTRRLFTHEGKSMSLRQWSEHLGINARTLASRIYVYKWPLERALTKAQAA